MLKILKHFHHCIEMPVRFSDLDAAGHVNNSRYQTYLEEARIAYSRDVFKMAVERFDFNAVVSSINLEFIKPVEYGDKIFIYTRLSNFQPNSHEVHNLVVREKDGKQEIMCKANTLMAAFDYVRKTPTTFPPEYALISEAYHQNKGL